MPPAPWFPGRRSLTPCPGPRPFVAGALPAVQVGGAGHAGFANNLPVFGGGGGSFVAAFARDALTVGGVRSGDGLVTIEFLRASDAVPVPAPGAALLFAAGLLGLAAARRRPAG